MLGLAISVLCVVGLFWCAGRWDWLKGWLYVATLALGPALSTLFVWRRDPELLRRRSRAGEGTPVWDKVVLGIFGLTWLCTPLVAALEVRQGRAALGLDAWWVLGFACYAAGLGLVTRAMLVNTHFEKTVRIQHDRAHQVVDRGPYAFVRHPGYVGALLAYPLAAPLLLGARWAWIPALVSASALVVRTALEDRLLQRELQGYDAYALKVRHRLVPGVW